MHPLILLLPVLLATGVFVWWAVASGRRAQKQGEKILRRSIHRGPPRKRGR